MVFKPNSFWPMVYRQSSASSWLRWWHSWCNFPMFSFPSHGNLRDHVLKVTALWDGGSQGHYTGKEGKLTTLPEGLAVEKQRRKSQMCFLGFWMEHLRDDGMTLFGEGTLGKGTGLGGSSALDDLCLAWTFVITLLDCWELSNML